LGSKGSGIVSLGLETVRFSPEESGIQDQGFFLVLQSSGLDGLKADGYAVKCMQGLTLPKQSAGSNSLLANMKSQQLIAQAVFALHLADCTAAKLPPSSLSFGSYDLAKYALSDFSYVPVDPNKQLWTVSLQRISFGTESVEENREAVFNTDIGVIPISNAAYTKLYRTICRIVECDITYVDIVFDCSNGEETALPDITFTLGGQPFALSWKHYIAREKQNCFSLVVPTNSETDILGLPFLRAYYTLFDAENYQVGLAQSINMQQPSSVWHICLGVGVVGVVVGVVWCLYRGRKRSERPTDLMEPLIRTDD